LLRPKPKKKKKTEKKKKKKRSKLRANEQFGEADLKTRNRNVVKTQKRKLLFRNRRFFFFFFCAQQIKRRALLGEGRRRGKPPSRGTAGNGARPKLSSENVSSFFSDSLNSIFLKPNSRKHSTGGITTISAQFRQLVRINPDQDPQKKKKKKKKKKGVICIAVG
jgi:hypothetical protein